MSTEKAIVIRDLDLPSDGASLQRVWREIGWSDSNRTDRMMLEFYTEGSTGVGTIDDEVECAVLTQPGTMRLDTKDLPLCVVSAVTTSRIARGLSLAQKLTARQLAKGQQDGAAVATLGMFDQGFYNKLGFGTGAYINEFSFDPALLNVEIKPRTPRRLTAEDSEQMLATMMARPRQHGSVTLNLPKTFKSELDRGSRFGLGYYEGDRLTHFVWMKEKGENGPYRVEWMGYETGDGLLELLALLKSLADQIYAVWMIEPPQVQLQSMLRRPFRSQAIAEKGKFSAEQETYAWYQLRILDLVQCVEALDYCGPQINFQLNLDDPMDQLLLSPELAEQQSSWQSLSGHWIVSLGQHAKAERGEDAKLPALTCNIGTLSRLFWGVSPASSLAISDGLRAPSELIGALDKVFTANPKPGWNF